MNSSNPVLRCLSLVLPLGVLVACGSQAAPASPPSSPAAISPASSSAQASLTPAASAAASASGRPDRSGNPSASGRPTPVNGTVTSFDGTKLVLSSGQSFTVTGTTQYVQSQAIKISDLAQGDLVAITAKAQPDGSLQASLVNVFPKSLSQVRTGQFPLDAGNLMTNATVQQVAADHFTAQYPGGAVTVTMAPGGQVQRQADVTSADVKAGENVSVLDAGGSVRQVRIAAA